MCRTAFCFTKITHRQSIAYISIPFRSRKYFFHQRPITSARLSVSQIFLKGSNKYTSFSLSTHQQAPQSTTTPTNPSPTMIRLSVLLALLHLTALNLAAPNPSHKSARQFEAAIFFIGAGPNPPSYLQLFPTDDTLHTISEFSNLSMPPSSLPAPNLTTISLHHMYSL